MKNVNPMTLCRLGLAIPMLALLATVAAAGADYVIVDETYDPPAAAAPAGWDSDTAQSISRQFVNEGVAKSMAPQLSATIADGQQATLALFQSGFVGGNELATRDNTVLSFDLKVDGPGLNYVGIHLDGFTDYLWTDMSPAKYSGSAIPIALGAYHPGVFKKITVPLNDPNTIQVGGSLFDPSARTFNNITLMVNSLCLATPASVKITVDNVKVTTKNAMIPFAGTSSSTYELLADGVSITEHGVAEHIGNYKAKYLLPYVTPFGTAEITAANGDKLIGTFLYGYGNEFAVQVEQGTGRFKGVMGSYRGLITGVDPVAPAFTSVLLGGLSTVGSNAR